MHAARPDNVYVPGAASERADIFPMLQNKRPPFSLSIVRAFVQPAFRILDLLSHSSRRFGSLSWYVLSRPTQGGDNTNPFQSHSGFRWVRKAPPVLCVLRAGFITAYVGALYWDKKGHGKESRQWQYVGQYGIVNNCTVTPLCVCVQYTQLCGGVVQQKWRERANFLNCGKSCGRAHFTLLKCVCTYNMKTFFPFALAAIPMARDFSFSISPPPPSLPFQEGKTPVVQQQQFKAGCFVSTEQQQ